MLRAFFAGVARPFPPTARRPTSCRPARTVSQSSSFLASGTKSGWLLVLFSPYPFSVPLSPRPCFCDTPPARDWLRPEDGRFWCRFGPSCSSLVGLACLRAAMRKIPSLRQSLSCAGSRSFRTLSIRLRNPTKTTLVKLEGECCPPSIVESRMVLMSTMTTK